MHIIKNLKFFGKSWRIFTTQDYIVYVKCKTHPRQQKHFTPRKLTAQLLAPLPAMKAPQLTVLQAYVVAARPIRFNFYDAYLSLSLLAKVPGSARLSSSSSLRHLVLPPTWPLYMHWHPCKRQLRTIPTTVTSECLKKSVSLPNLKPIWLMKIKLINLATYKKPSLCSYFKGELHGARLFMYKIIMNFN